MSALSIVLAAPGGQRIAGAGQLLLLDQQLLAGGIPTPAVTRSAESSSWPVLPQVLVDDAGQALLQARLRSIRSVAWLSTPGSSESQWVRPRSYAAARRYPRAGR